MTCSEPILTIAIPTFNNFQQLGWCLNSLFLNVEFPYKITLIDNGCNGDVKRYIENISFGDLKVLEPNENLGWMRAINLAADTCSTPYFAMMNDDVVFIPGQKEFWRVLCHNLADDNVGAVGPCSNFIAGNQSLMQMDTPLVFNASFLIGMCMVTRLATFKEVGMLDPALPGGDDLDFSIRLSDAGYDLRVDRTAYLHHIGQQTGRRVHGEGWDSKWMQEVTINALIAKHGVRKWYECYKAGWNEIPAIMDKLEIDDEEKWYRTQIKELDGLEGLNIGCGNNRLEESHGVDVRRNGDVSGAGKQKGLEVDSDIVADATNLPLQNCTKDYIIAGHVLEHIVNPIATLREWRRVLKPGGKLMLTVPNHRQIDTMIIDHTHLHAFDVKSVWDTVTSAGFENVESAEDGFGTLRVTARVA